MPKKEVEKHIIEKHHYHKVHAKKDHVIEKLKRQDEFNAVLIENFVSLQKVMTHLLTKMDSLTDQTSKLLSLFELSAKTFSERLSTAAPEIEKDREFLDKLNKLLDQNKLIAKGLTLMEEKMRERLYGGASSAHPKFPAPSSPYLPSSIDSEKSPKAMEI